jgi:transcriptional regulator with XRE-family HTH domain
MSVGDISRIESGRLRPYPSQLEKLARALGVQPDELLQDVAELAEAARS